MDKRIEEIITGFQRLLNGIEGSFIGTVEEDKTDMVNVKDLNGTVYPDVRKIATSGKKGFVPMLPKGSYVIVSRISKSDDLFISMMTEIEAINLNVDDTIIINDGKNDGLVIVGKLVEKLNTLEKAINTHTHPYVNVNVAATTSATTSQMIETQQAEIENEKIKH